MGVNRVTEERSLGERNIQFCRLVRTSGSESYLIWGYNIDKGVDVGAHTEWNRLGRVDTHYVGSGEQMVIHSIFLLEGEGWTKAEAEELIEYYELTVIENDHEYRAGHLITIYQGNCIGEWSDSAYDKPPSIYDLQREIMMLHQEELKIREILDQLVDINSAINHAVEALRNGVPADQVEKMLKQEVFNEFELGLEKGLPKILWRHHRGRAA